MLSTVRQAEHDVKYYSLNKLKDSRYKIRRRRAKIVYQTLLIAIGRVAEPRYMREILLSKATPRLIDSASTNTSSANSESNHDTDCHHAVKSLVVF